MWCRLTRLRDNTLNPNVLLWRKAALIVQFGMRPTRLTSTVLFLIGVMSVTAGCSTVDTIQNTTSGTLALQQNEDSSSGYVNSVTNTLGGYYDETVSFLTDSCGVGGDTRSLWASDTVRCCWGALRSIKKFSLGCRSRRLH